MSNINYLNINENFPVAGQDNDTQTFRDNFDTIKTSLRFANQEVTDIETNGARLDQANDFNSNNIQNAVLDNVSWSLNKRGTPDATTLEVDFTSGTYHVININSNKTIEFTNFPGQEGATETVSGGVGKCIVELYSSGGTHLINFVASGGTAIKKDPNFPVTFEVSSTGNPRFIEVWRHSTDKIFLRYLGEYS